MRFSSALILGNIWLAAAFVATERWRSIACLVIGALFLALAFFDRPWRRRELAGGEYDPERPAR